MLRPKLKYESVKIAILKIDDVIVVSGLGFQDTHDIAIDNIVKDKFDVAHR